MGFSVSVCARLRFTLRAGWRTRRFKSKRTVRKNGGGTAGRYLLADPVHLYALPLTEGLNPPLMFIQTTWVAPFLAAFFRASFFAFSIPTEAARPPHPEVPCTSPRKAHPVTIASSASWTAGSEVWPDDAQPETASAAHNTSPHETSHLVVAKLFFIISPRALESCSLGPSRSSCIEKKANSPRAWRVASSTTGGSGPPAVAS